MKGEEEKTGWRGKKRPEGSVESESDDKAVYY